MFTERPSLLTDLVIPLFGVDTGTLFSLSKEMSKETPCNDDLTEIRIKEIPQRLMMNNNEIFTFGFTGILRM